jgi:hypothetical protein
MKKIFLNSFLFLFLFVDIQAQQLPFSEDQSLSHYCSCEEMNPKSDSIRKFSAGKKVLETGFEMAFVYRTMIKGSCWDFVNEVYRKSGITEKEKKTVFRSSKSGPYAAPDMVQPGDWIYHVNHQYNNIEHSAIFVCWKDFANKIAVTLSYAGRNRTAAAKYAEYDLKSIYSIFRPERE